MKTTKKKKPRASVAGTLNVKQLVKQSYELAREKGWWRRGELGEHPNIPEKLALIHSEISEALEDYRQGYTLDKVTYDVDGKPCGFGIELADAVIRIADLCGYLCIDLENAVAEKHKYNKTRTHRHGGKLA